MLLLVLLVKGVFSLVHDFKEKEKLERYKFFINLICSIFVALLLFIFTLAVFSKTLASETFYLTQNDINNFISAYNSFYGVDLADFNLGNRGYFACGVYKNSITDRYNLFLYNGSSAKTVGDGSSTFSLQEVDGSKVFYLFDLKNGTWSPIGSKLNNTTSSIDGNSLFITDNIAVISTSNHVYFKYNLANSIIKNQVDDIVQQITVINNNYTVLNEQVSAIDNKVNDLQNENAGVSQKLDTVIDNQQIINNNISSTGNQISQHLDTVNTSINNQGNQISSDLNNINNSITTVPDDLTDNTIVTSEDIKNSLDFQFTVDPYANFWEHVVNGLQDSFINKNQIFNINWLDGKTYQINVDDVIPAYPLAFKQLLTMVSTTVFAFPILKYIKKTVDLISSGSADELLEINEEEGYIDMF